MMRVFTVLLAWLVLASPMPATAQDAADAPVVAPPVAVPAAPVSVEAAPELPPVDPAVMEILRRLETAADRYAALRTDVVYTLNDRLTGETERRTGWLVVAFANEANELPHRFRVHFQTLQVGNQRPARDELDYAFDGHWYTVAKHPARQMIKSQVAPGSQPFDLERGYFPMPFGQKAQDVVRSFEVATRPLREGEPEGTTYLRLVPRAEQRARTDVIRAEVWLHNETHLPARWVSVDSNRKQTTIEFNNPRIDPPHDREMFNPPRPPGWSLHVERLPQPDAAPAPQRD